VTCDDFAQAIADANPKSPLAHLLPQFKRWYSQAGTPRLKQQILLAGHQRPGGELPLHFPA
jgi:aminopeptidase N